MNAINRKTISRRIFKLVLPLFIILLARAGSFAQAPPNSVFCANDGQVCAFDGEREVIYGANGILIKKSIKGGSICLPQTFGIDDPVPNVLKSCYIVNNSTVSVNSSTVNLSGAWTMFEGNGKQYEKNAVITQTGASVNLDNGYGSQATENLVGSKLNVRAWKLTGTVSADGKRIDWSNGFYWVKKDLWNRPEIDRLPDNKQETVPFPEASRPRRLITIKNKSGFNISGNLIMRFDYDSSENKGDIKSNVTTGGLMSGQGETLNVPFDNKTDYELWIRLDGDKPLFIATLPKNENLATLCYEVSGTYFVPSVKACEGATTYEAKYISFKNEAGYNAVMSLTYYPIGKTTTRKLSTLTTTGGYQTKLYLPLDADTQKQMVLKVTPDGGGDLLARNVAVSDFESTCYKVWGIIGTPKVGACSLNTNARKIKFWNNAGYSAKMQVTYDAGQMVETNFIEVTETETIEVPNGSSNSPIKISLINKWTGKEVSAFTASANFTGDLCYKVEGTNINPSGATCDDTIGDTSGETRQIRFQNDAGYDAQMIVIYFMDEVINGQTISMPKTLVTGMISGLGGKFRLVTIPKNTSKGMSITISLQGNATVKNDVWSTTLPADFAASPQPCFKVTGTLFDPSGGKCSQ